MVDYSPFDLVMWKCEREAVKKALEQLGGRRVNADPF